jgi:hypothetical protein
VVAAVFAMGGAAHAATIPVTNTNEGTPAPPGSLRAAIEAANSDADLDVIDATGVSGTINLQTALPPIQQEVEIRGPGASTLTVRRAASAVTDFRIFQFLLTTAEISSLTIANGRTTDASVGGAGIYNDRTTLTLRGAVVAGNVNAGTSNGADGGGILNQSSGTNATLTIVDSTVAGNTAAGNGGGILNGNNSTLTILRSTMSANTAQDGAGCPGGGAIRNQGILTVRNSTLTGNSAPIKLGGGILTCSTSPSLTTIVNSTIASNTAPQAANLGVLGSPVPDDRITFRSAIVSDPRGGGDNCQTQDGGILTSQGYNLASDASCILAATADQPSTDPMLGPLASNGGPTRTMALAPDSPAVDKGIPNGQTTDQRGLTRLVDFAQIPNAPGGDGSDIGAFEVQALPTPPGPPSNEFSFGKVKKNKRKGTAKLTIEIAEGPGELELAKTKKVKSDDEAVEGEGANEEKLTIKPKGKARKRLARKGKAKVKAEVTYTPTGGEPLTKTKKLRLKRR